MEAISSLISRLHADGVRLWVEAGNIRYRAPPGVLTAVRLKEIGARKQELLDALSDEAASTQSADVPWPITHVQRAFFEYYNRLRDPLIQHIRMTKRLLGPLDLAILRRAFEQLYERHAILRSRFVRGPDGVVAAVTDAQVRVELAVSDLSHVDAASRNAAASQLLEDVGRAWFDLDSGPLSRLHLVRVAEEEHLLAFVLHHTICDASGSQILSRDFAAIHAGLLSGVPAKLPPLPLQFPEFARRYQSWLETQQGRGQLVYWRDLVRGDSHPFWLPDDAPPFHMPDPLQPAPGFQLGADTTAAMRRFARQHDSTTAMVMLSALMLALSRWSGHQRVHVLMVHNGRVSKDLQDMVGCLVEAFVVRADLQGADTFGEVLSRVRQAHRDALAHVRAPFWLVREELTRLPPFEPILHIHFNYQVERSSPPPANAPAQDSPALESPVRIENIGLPVSRRTSLDDATGARLNIGVVERDASVRCAVAYSWERFHLATIERFCKDVEQRMNALC